MRSFSKSLPFLLLLGIIACSTLLINPAQARADDDDDGWNFGWANSDEKSDDDQVEDSGNHDHHGGHHGHQEPVLAAASPLGVPKQASGGLQNANFAAHNESCSPAGKSCTEKQNLVCSATDGTGRCICAPGFVYVRQTETCWPIPKSDQDACQHDVQCHAGTWGSHSRCDKHVAKCECYDYATGGKRPMVYVQGVCYIEKNIGDLCNSDEECDKPIRGDAYCQRGDHQSAGGANYYGACQCLENNKFFRPVNACLPLSTKLNDKCVITEQCKEGSLGRLSKCMEDGTCKCHSDHEEKETVYYELLKKCFKRKNINDTCNDVDECRASLGPDVECGVVLLVPEPEVGVDAASRNNTRVCHCPPGKECKNSAYSPLSSIFTLAFAFTAAVFGGSALMKGI